VWVCKYGLLKISSDFTANYGRWHISGRKVAQRGRERERERERERGRERVRVSESESERERDRTVRLVFHFQKYKKWELRILPYPPHITPNFHHEVKKRVVGMLYRWMLRPTQHVRNRSTAQTGEPRTYLSEIMEWSSYFSFLYASVLIFPSFMFFFLLENSSAFELRKYSRHRAPELPLIFTGNPAVRHDWCSGSGPRGPKQTGDRGVPGVLVLRGLVLFVRGVAKCRGTLPLRRIHKKSLWNDEDGRYSGREGSSR